MEGIMDTGKRGEAIAERYLSTLGYEILERNYRSRFGEIDLVASHHGVIVFVEVKTRSTIRQGLPCEAVNREKQRRIRRMARYYLMVQGQSEAECRMDIIEIILQGKGTLIRQITDAF